MSRLRVLAAWMLPLMVLLAVSAFGQTTASIKGTVTDGTGAAVVGARVSVKGPVGIDRATQTNSGGDFEIPALPPGNYSVEVSMKGFQTQQAKDVVLQVSQNSVQNFSLKVATASEVITVEATAPVIEATTMTVGQVINQQTVQEIPLNGRHFVDLALLVPGTVTPPANGFLTAPLRGQGSFAFNSAGAREDAVNFMINGINLSDMVQNQVTFQPTINTVSEFKIDNSTYSAEFGRNSGSIVNIATRSGTNQFHGELYDYLRNDFFDARNAFNRVTTSSGAPNPISPFKRNQFGGDIGGPIKKGKTYFFASYEGLRNRQGLTTTAGVFTATQRAAIVAGANPVSNAIMALVPQPNTILSGSVPNGFIGSATAPVNIDQGTIDISHTFNDTDTLHGYYVYQADLRQEPTQGSNIPGFGDTRQGHRQVFTLGETHVFSPNIVNEFRVGANRIHILFSPNNLTSPASLGLSTALGPNEQFMPTITVQDQTGLTFGDERAFPQGRGDTGIELADTLSYLHGKHSFKFGVEARDFRNNNFNGDPGQMIFSSTANFAAGTVLSAARTVGNVANRINVGALDFFGQDSWRVTPALTVELGLRYAWNMTPSEAMNRLTNVVPGAGTGTMLVNASQPYAQNNSNFQPRVGFAWDVFHHGNTILRGGYGYQVDQPISGVVTGLNANPPFAVPINVGIGAISGLATQFNPNNPNISISPLMVNPNFKNADVQSWNLNLEQQVTKTLGVMVGYFGAKGTHLEIDRDINQFGVLGSAQVVTPQGTLNPTRPFQFISPSSPIFPGTALGNTITERDSSGTSSYNALWVTANKRVSHGLQFNGSYTWSHSIDTNSRNDQGVVIPDSTNVFSGVGNSDFDARHRFVVNAIYNLPFKGNRFVEGWEIAPIATWQSGNPFNIVNTSTAITGVGTVTPNAIGPIVVSHNALGPWIVPTGFSGTNVPMYNGIFQLTTTSLGNMGRNSVVGPTFTNLDLALAKNTKVTERITVQFRCDAFDLFNHPNYSQPSGTLANTTSGTFGVISATRFPTGDSGSSRQLQLALKLMF